MSPIDRLLEIMARLRDPESGCPWDLEQDFASISPHTIEEAYEVDEAIASGDPAALQDELGDLLFQVVFQARIAEEKGLFDFEGVVEAIGEKLVRRHPHVFGDANAPADARAQLASWEDIKAAERAAAAGEGPPDPFEGIPRRLPALARSAKIGGRLGRLDGETRAALAPADREDAPGHHLAAADQAAAALRASIQRGEARDTGPASAEAIGAVLQAWARLARRLGVDPEQALRDADDRTIAAVRPD